MGGMTLTKSIALTLAGIFFFLALIAGTMIVMPRYRVYSRTMDGKAKLQEAEFSKQALVEQARAERDSAELHAEAIQIVGEAAKEFPEYREQMFMQSYSQAVESGAVKMIFVPTEANVPILVSP
jgi:regulator of protease activity HflC (stomatin/prohibitin superfamily)